MLCAKHAAPMRATGSASPLLPGRVSSAVVRPRCFMRPGRLVVRSTLEPPTDPTGSARPPHITSAFTPGPGPSTPGGPTGSSVPPYTTGSTSSTGPRLGGGPGFPGTPTGGSGGGGGGSGGHGHSGAGGPPSGWSLGRIAWLLLGVTMTYTLGRILYNMITGQTEADRTIGKLAADDVAVRGELAKEKGKNIVSSVKHATGHAVDKAVHKAEELAHDAHVAALKAEQRLERAKDKVEHSVSHAVDSTKHALALTSEEARHKAAEAGQDARYAKDQAKHAVKDTYKDAKYAVKDTAKDAKHAAELKAKDAKRAMDTAGREAEYGAKSAAKGTLETVKDAASSVGHALMWGGAKAESGTRRGINKLEKETGVYSAPTGTTRTADRRALYGTITGLAVGTSVLVGLWVWDRAGRPSGGDMAKKAKESGSEMAKKAQDAVGQAADTIKSAAAKTTGTTGVDPNAGTRVY